MQVKLAYGRQGLAVDIPDTADIILPRYVPGLQDEVEALKESLREPIDSPPLASLVKPGDRVVVVHTDITRATPNDRILPVLLAELEAYGIARQDITLLNGLGTHRRQTEAELISMLGAEIFAQYRCFQHDCHDDAQLVALGPTSRGHPVRINRHYLEADVRILTGFIEPHFFAGFSGGPKAILPSLAGVESVFTNHGLGMIADKRSTWGVLDGNPIWEEMSEVALRTHPTFLINVTLNSQRQMTAIFAGQMLAAHAAGCEFVKQHAMVGVPEAYDIVLTTNSGYPLDQNLYQSVKGMSAASQVVRQGGAIIMAAACEDGLPDHGLYADLLRQGGTPQGVLDLVSQPGFVAQDQWQVQIQAQIQKWADVYVYSDGLADDQIQQALLIPIRNLSVVLSNLMDKYGPKARLCVLPEGPLTIPYLLPQGVLAENIKN